MSLESLRRLLGHACRVVFLLMALAPPLRAQVTSIIQGRVTDSSGAAVVGAAVKATNVTTGFFRTDESAADGFYRLRDIPPGPYEVRVAFTGFKVLVKKEIAVAAQATLNVDAVLQVGDLNTVVDVIGGAPQIETTESRISSVLDARSIDSLPSIGRSLLWLTMITPGVQGKAEDTRGGFCCDSLQANAAPRLATSGNEDKSVFMVDGVALHYGDGAGWGLAFTPNPDAVEEVRISANPTSAEEGAMGGVQVQMVTKGGTNSYHGTAHYTFMDASLNAVPYGASKADVGSGYSRYFGGTIGGPILKDRLMFFAAYEGARAQQSSPAGSFALVETQAFKDSVVATRPNSIAADLLTKYPPAAYPTRNLVDLNGDGVPDVGEIPLDTPSARTGNQFNARVDYLSPSGKDRIYATYWHSKTVAGDATAASRPEFTGITLLPSSLSSLVNTHAFSPSVLNDLRVSYWTQSFDYHLLTEPYNVPVARTDDGNFSLGVPGFSREVQNVKAWDLKETLEWNKGRHNFKVGASYRKVYVSDPAYSNDGDIPLYDFATIFDFANDKPYRETRVVDPSTGKLRDAFVEYGNQQVSAFFQNTWRIKDGLTLNYGVRWDNFFNLKMTGFTTPTELYQPLFSSGQLNPSGIVGIVNKLSKDSYDTSWGNFGPRISLAWDPTRKGTTVLRAGFFLLYDEVRSVGPYRNYYAAPPRAAQLQAGAEFGIPIVYTGVAPSRDEFPINPGLKGVAIDTNLGSFIGTRPDLFGFPRDFQVPKTYDFNAAVEHQLFANLAVSAIYHYRHTPNEQFGFDANRASGDLVDGSRDRINPYYDGINVQTNLGRRTSHGVSVTLRKRYSAGWLASASYGFNAGWDDLDSTEVFQPGGWSRIEGATHTFKAFTIWDLPIFKEAKGALGHVLGGWQLTTAWNLESGFYFNPVSGRSYGNGGDFNADGQGNDRPDLPAGGIPTSYTQDQWLSGAIPASSFPLPTTVRNGTLPRNYFTGPGYFRIDAGLSKGVKLRLGSELRFSIQASNLLNHVNIRGVQNNIASSSFARATAFYPMRTVQAAVKLTF
jgi:carboxypeptidase family protein